ncbi:hypothetical protein CPC08DRAFT_427732 [Agrocybe pediades]|nr:hypothetical protein CPC08DRAFT_427732 [Agrocybe pediades]
MTFQKKKTRITLGYFHIRETAGGLLVFLHLSCTMFCSQSHLLPLTTFGKPFSKIPPLHRLLFNQGHGPCHLKISKSYHDHDIQTLPSLCHLFLLLTCIAPL